MPKTWTSQAQKEWLAKELPKFTEEQAAGRTERFFAQTMEKWFKEFPEEDVLFPSAPGDSPRGMTDGERLQLSRAKLARRKIFTWYWWYSKRQAHLKTKPGLGVFEMNGAHMRRERAPHAVEVYQHLFPEKVRTAMALERKAEGAVSAGERLKVQRKVAMEMFKADKEAHAAVSEELARLKEEKRMKQRAENSDDPECCERTAAEYHKALKELPAVLLSGLQAVSNNTGWVLCVLAAGPTPSSNGAICMEEYYVGPKSLAGLDFMNAHIDFERDVRIPFGEHIQTCFSMEVRSKRSLNRTGSKNAGSKELDGLIPMSRSVTPETQTADTDWDEFDSDSDDDSTNKTGRQPPATSGTPPTPESLVHSPSMATSPATHSPRKDALDRFRTGRRSVTVSDNDDNDGPWGNQAWLNNPDSLFNPSTPSTPPPGSGSSIAEVPGGPTSPISHAFARMAAYSQNEGPVNSNSATKDSDQAWVNLDYLDPALRPVIPSLPHMEGITSIPTPLDHVSMPTVSINSSSYEVPDTAVNNAIEDITSIPTPLNHVSMPTASINSLSYEVPGAAVNDALADPSQSAALRQKPKPRPVTKRKRSNSKAGHDSGLTPAQKRAATIAAKKAAASNLNVGGRSTELSLDSPALGSGTAHSALAAPKPPLTHSEPAGDGIANLPLTPNTLAGDGATVASAIPFPIHKVSVQQPHVTKPKRANLKAGHDSGLTPAQKRAATIAAKKAAANNLDATLNSATTVQPGSGTDEPLVITDTQNSPDSMPLMLGSALPSLASSRGRRAIKPPAPRDASPPTVRKN